MSFENVSGHNKEPERELLTMGHQNRRRGDDDYNTTEESSNAKSGVQDSTATKKLYSFECAEREIERRLLAMEKRRMKNRLWLEERLHGKPSLTAARIEQIGTEVKLQIRGATHSPFHHRLLSLERAHTAPDRMRGPGIEADHYRGVEPWRY